MRRWEFVAGGSAKFWEVGRDGTTVTVRFGRLGTAGQAQTKELASDDAAEAHVAKLVADKEKKGYRSVGAEASAPVAPAAPAAKPSVADEDTWVMPSEWLRQAARRRDREPLPRFAVDSASVREFRDLVADRAQQIAGVRDDPRSDQDLARVLLDHLDGRPDPLGAAALARIVVDAFEPPVHSWISEHGLPFATAAILLYAKVFVRGYVDGQTGRRFDAYLTNELLWNIAPDSTHGRALIQVRAALAVADSATYDAAVAELEKFDTSWFDRVVRAFLVPTRRDWYEEASSEPQSESLSWMVQCTASTVAELAGVLDRRLIRSSVSMYTALHTMGPVIAPLLAQELDTEVAWGADYRRFGIKVLTALPTDEAFTILLDRQREKYVRPALLAAMSAFPLRAARLLAARAAEDSDARDLLRAHMTTHPDLELPTETAELLAEAGSLVVPDAPAAALPRVLAEPPWTHARPQPKPLVLNDVPVPAAHITWLDGERAEWAEWACYGANYHYDDWERLADQIRAGRNEYRDYSMFLNGPEELARPLLAVWQPHYNWDGESWGRRIAARFGLDALPAVLRIASANPQSAGVVLLPYATPEVAEMMSDWLVRLKSARVFAIDWLARHREAAAHLLLPLALGAPGPRRRNAEIALRHLHLSEGVDVLALVSGAAETAVRTLIDVDPLDVLPSKLPVIGEWADTRLLPQILLADRKSALSAEAARALLMTAALSKPDAVYAGLSQAVEVCDPASLAEFAWTVFEHWQGMGAPAKDGWALHALGWFGDDETVRRLSPLIRAWPGESAHAKAVTGLDVLAGIGTEVALTHLNGIAEKVKFKALKARAQEKVADIAAELGLTRDQLADRLVPSFGLDEAATLMIDYGSRRFTVGFDEHLRPYVLDPDGKRRKELPKPGARDDQELAPAEHKRFGALKKDVRTVAGDQIHRLERAMVTQRTWTADEFHTVLAAHPLLWHIVRRLVWITDSGLTFRLAEDRTLAGETDDEVTLPGTAAIRVAHPVELEGSLSAWSEIFADYEILQPFPQLGRPVHAFTPGEPHVPQLQKYLGHPVPVGKILGLTKHGWVRGEPQDAGVECWITRPLPAGGSLVAGLDPGIAVGAVDVFPEVSFTELWFSPDDQGSWRAPQDGGPASFEVDPITASELLSELESLLATQGVS